MQECMQLYYNVIIRIYLTSVPDPWQAAPYICFTILGAKEKFLKS